MNSYCVLFEPPVRRWDGFLGPALRACPLRVVLRAHGAGGTCPPACRFRPLHFSGRLALPGPAGPGPARLLFTWTSLVTARRDPPAPDGPGSLAATVRSWLRGGDVIAPPARLHAARSSRHSVKCPWAKQAHRATGPGGGGSPRSTVRIRPPLCPAQGLGIALRSSMPSSLDRLDDGVGPLPTGHVVRRNGRS